MLDEVDQASCSKLLASLRLLESRSRENETFFTGPNRLDLIDKTFRENFFTLHQQISSLFLPLCREFYKLAPQYDADVGLRANGIRSWLDSIQRLTDDLNKLCSFIESKRQSVFFRRVKIARNLKTLVDYLKAVGQCLVCVKEYTRLSPDCIIVDRALDDRVQTSDLLNVISNMRLINVKAFRGRTACFHFDESIGKVAHGILLSFAAYCQTFKLNLELNHENDRSTCDPPGSPDSGHCESPVSRSNSPSVSSSSDSISPKKQPISNGRIFSFVTSRDVLAEEVRWGLANFGLKDLQTFWNIGDNPLLLASIDLVIPTVAVSRVINLHSIPIEVPLASGPGRVTVDAPESGTGLRLLKSRLISSVMRLGQEYWYHDGNISTSKLAPVSDAIVFHVHGGGFICQSSRSQEVYLRQFCKRTNVPFYCVDYSLLPGDFFPRAVEEVLYAYCWMLLNFRKLGTAGKRIVCSGDSAGCCLLMSMCVRLIDMGIRLPDAMHFVYPYACASFAPSPSRLLSFADPIVPIPLLLRCCFGYAGLPENDARIVLGIKDKSDFGTDESPSFKSPTVSFQFSPGEAEIVSNQEQNSMEIQCTPLAPVTNRLKHSKSAFLLETRESPGEPATRRSSIFPNTPRVHNGSSKCSKKFNSEFSLTSFSPDERAKVAEMLANPIFQNGTFSPMFASKEILSKMPHIHIIASTADPLLDDSVALCKRLRHSGAKCDMTILNGLPHGFLNLGIVSGACREGCDKSVQVLEELTKL